MTAAVTTPGLYADMPASVYHADPCPSPSLSASLAWLMETECPELVHHAHPRLNPDQEPESKKSFDIGTATHLLVLEPDQFAERTVIIDADSYRTKAAQEARDAAYEAGKTPLLLQDEVTVMDLRDTIRARPMVRDAFASGLKEATLVWIDEETGIYCRCRVDNLWTERAFEIDLKTSTSANPNYLRRIGARLGWHSRAAWYLEGYRAVFGEDPPPTYWFVAISTKPPHPISVLQMDDNALAWGRQINRLACRRFAQCLESGQWPGYRDPMSDRDAPFTLDLPPYIDRDLERRHERGEFSTLEAADVLSAA